VTDEYAVFEANENYWGEQPSIKKITVKVIPDNQTRIMALEKGALRI
jgi:nickel transport system substrate-binding protein